MQLTKYEQETILNFNEEGSTASIYTHNKAMRRKLERFAHERPDDRRLYRECHDGQAVEYSIPKSWIRINPPRIASEAQRAAFVKARQAANKVV